MSRSVSQTIVLIGTNISRSRSPAFLNALFDTFDLPLQYELLPTDPVDLEHVIRHIAASGAFKGANITAPYKEDVVQYLDDLTETAQRLQAVNTISIEDGRMVGYNTDVEGLRTALARFVGEEGMKGVAILGTGGAAAAGVEALLSISGLQKIQVVSRQLERARQFTRRWLDNRIEPIRNDAFRGAELIVNATPVGSSAVPGMPVQAESLDGVAYLYDMIYNPAETELMRAARLSGAHVANGVSMLEAQALESFRIWTGIDPSTTQPPQG